MTSLILPCADTSMMNLFLEHVSRTFSQYFLVIQLDQAGWHSAKDLVIPENIRLIPQPAYSPELNPVEHIWKEIRENPFLTVLFHPLMPLLMPFVINYDNLKIIRSFCIL